MFYFKKFKENSDRKNRESEEKKSLDFTNYFILKIHKFYIYIYFIFVHFL